MFRFPSGFGVTDLAMASGGTAAGLQIGPRADILLHDDLSAEIVQSIAMILATTPGERVMEPEFGTRLHELVFEPNDATTAGMAIQYVLEAVARWEPRALVQSVDAGPDPDRPSHLVIALAYRIPGRPDVNDLDIRLDLQRGAL